MTNNLCNLLIYINLKPKDMENFEKLKTIIANMEGDVIKFNQGNKSAGTRVRKALQEVKSTAQDLRLEIQAAKNNG